MVNQKHSILSIRQSIDFVHFSIVYKGILKILARWKQLQATTRRCEIHESKRTCPTKHAKFKESKWPETLLPAATKLWPRFHFYTCLSFCSQWGSASVHAGIPPSWEQTPPDQTPPPQDQTPRDQTPPGADTPQDQTPPDQTPSPGKQTPAYGIRAAGTHPTGMHSCFHC